MTGKGYCGRCLGQSERGTVCGKGTGTTTEGPRYTRDDTVQWRKARRQTPVSLLCVEVPGAVNLLCIQVQVRRPRGCPNLRDSPEDVTNSKTWCGGQPNAKGLGAFCERRRRRRVS
jgi:hypothetical protein